MRDTWIHPILLLAVPVVLVACAPPSGSDEAEIEELTQLLVERMRADESPTPLPSVEPSAAMDVQIEARARELAEAYHAEIDDRYIVVLDEHEMSMAGIHDPGVVAGRHALQTEHVYEHAFKGFTARLDEKQRERLESDPRVEFIQPDNLLFADDRPVPRGVDRIDADLHRTADIDGVSGTIDVTVAILDSGIDLDHPDLNVVGGIDFVTTDADNGGDDLNGHGTHCAGIVGALDDGVDFGAGSNPRAIAGVAPGAKLWAVRVLDENGSGSTSWSIDAINWMVGCVRGTDPTCPSGAGDIRVANMSLGCECGTTGCTCSDVTGDALKLAIENAMAAGITFTMSAGNADMDVGGESSCGYYPSCFSAPIVTASMTDFDGTRGRLSSCPAYCGYTSDTDDQRASYSNYGSNVDIVAPGTCIESTYHGNACNDCDLAPTQCESPTDTVCVTGTPGEYYCCEAGCTSCEGPNSCPAGKTGICRGGGYEFCCIVARYTTMSGTSMAAPHAAGAAALVIDEHRDNHGSDPTPSEVRATLLADGDTGPCGTGSGSSCSNLSGKPGLYVGVHRDSMEVSGYSIDMALQHNGGFADLTTAVAHHGGTSVGVGVHDSGPDPHGYAGVEFCLSENESSNGIADYLLAGMWLRFDHLVDWTGIGVSGDDAWLYWWWIREDGSVIDEEDRFGGASVTSIETWHYVEITIDRRDANPSNHVASLSIDGDRDTSIPLANWEATTADMSCVFVFSGVNDDTYQDLYVDEVYVRALPGGGF